MPAGSSGDKRPQSGSPGEHRARRQKIATSANEASPARTESPDWGESDPVEGDLGGDDLKTTAAEQAEAFRILLEESLVKRRRSFRKRPDSAGGDPSEGLTVKPADKERVVICDQLYRYHRDLPSNVSVRNENGLKWREIFHLAIEGTLSQLKNGQGIEYWHQ